MGCSSSCIKYSPEAFNSDLEKSLATSNFNRFKALICLLRSSSKEEFNINTYTLSAFSMKILTLPALSIIYGQKEFFQYLFEQFPLNLEKLNNLFTSLKVSSLFFLCSRNYHELLLYYLPIYLSNKSLQRSRPSYSLSFGEFSEQEVLTTYTPIQIACEFGHITILKIVSDCLKEFGKLTDDLDIHYIDPITQENCALIACKTNYYLIIRFLHTVCQADFSILNKRRENAIQVACMGRADLAKGELAKILRYLVEEVKVNVEYNYEYTLQVCKDAESLEYLSEILQDAGLVPLTQNSLNSITIINSLSSTSSSPSDSIA